MDHDARASFLCIFIGNFKLTSHIRQLQYLVLQASLASRLPFLVGLFERSCVDIDRILILAKCSNG